MNINHAMQQTYQEGHLRPQNHCEYFQNLEQRLLEDSEKLTSFMGKSLISDKSKTRLKVAASPPRDHSLAPIAETEPTFNRRSLKNQLDNNQKPCIKRAKQLCQKIKSPKLKIEGIYRSPEKPLREKYENQKNLECNITHIIKEDCKNYKEKNTKNGSVTDKVTKEEKEKADFNSQSETRHQKVEKTNSSEMQQKLERPPRLQKTDKFEKNDQMKKIFKRIVDSKSLTDTISTESCKSLKSLDQISTTSIYQRVKLEDFQILKYLAQGKFGSVYLVRHKVSNFVCALKRIPSSTIKNDPKILIQRIREIKIQSYLDHPNTVQLYAVFVEQNDLYLLMEPCCSGNLYQSLKIEGRFGQQRIRGIIKQVCYAVQYMHDNDILHRDLKPQNILFHESIVKICDFGWSVNSPLLRDTVCGTPLYSSPELIQKQQYDNKVDIWNIGILTYELLYGKAPFQIRTEDDLSKVIDDDIYFPRSKPASLEIKDFILRCLSKNPKERFTIAKLIDHPFLNPEDLTKSC